MINDINTLCIQTIRYYSDIGRIRLSISMVSRIYELSGITHVTPFREYGKRSTGPSTYGPLARTYSKLFSFKTVLTVEWNLYVYGRVSRGSLPRVRRYSLLYLRTVEYVLWESIDWTHYRCSSGSHWRCSLTTGSRITWFEIVFPSWTIANHANAPWNLRQQCLDHHQY